MELFTELIRTRVKWIALAFLGVLPILSFSQENSSVQGKVFYDINGNCVQDNDEPGLGLIPVGAFFEAEAWYAVTDPGYQVSDDHGRYSIDDFNSSNFSLKAFPVLDSVFELAPCADLSNLSFPDGQIQTYDIPMVAVVECSEIIADMVISEALPDSECLMYINYFNYGTVTANNSRVSMVLDKRLEFVSTEPLVAFEVFEDYAILFPGNVEVGEGKPTEVKFSVDVEAGLDQVLTNQIHGLSSGSCDSVEVWDQSSILVEGDCNQNDSVVFIISNVGTGDMGGSRDFVILQDDLLVHSQGNFILNAGESDTVAFAGTSAFYTIEAEQSPSHPFLGDQVAVVEPCLPEPTSIQVGETANHYGDDASPLRLQTIQPTVQGEAELEIFPFGTCGDNHVLLDQRIEFTMRFRHADSTIKATNAGFNMQLPDELDFSTFRPGASNYYYRVNNYNGLLEWRLLAPIGMADTYEPYNEYLMKFSIKAKPTVESSTLLEASFMVPAEVPIWSDVEERKFVDTLSCIPDLLVDLPESLKAEVRMVPNPAADMVTVRTTAHVSEIRVYSLEGRLRKIENDRMIDVSDLASGVYVLEVQTESGVAVSKLVVQH